ncbi:hypothetical protein SADUNF_Sadunf03G0160300 [Salix dunnii]|uniref:Uncharacterized protein n=1 Tax=Salix dunnii TaxID=1413687 RepID=A0A835N596_9ROSI|nr:hypothetical protein SADUNF_Sadunf03G0160300 [Salix dunnii]
MFFAWCAEIAHEFGAFHAIFSRCGGFGFACYHSLWLNLPHQNNLSDEFTLPDFPEACTIHVTQLNADGILLNAVEELDNIGLAYFRRKIGKPVWQLGPFPSPIGATIELQLHLSDMLELALEAGGKFFIWVVRPPIGFDINMEFKAKEWLPEGFEERMEYSKRGLLVRKWAPQDQFGGLQLPLVKTDILERDSAAWKLDATWHDIVALRGEKQAPLIDKDGPLTGSEMVTAVLGLQAVPGSEYD